MELSRRKLAEQLSIQPNRITKLIADGKLVVNAKNKIDTEDEHNKRYLEFERAENRRKFYKADDEEVQEPSEEDLEIVKSKYKLEVEYLKERTLKEKTNNKILNLKLRREKREVVDTDTLNRVILHSYDFLFKNILEMPSLIVDEMLDISKKEDPRNLVIKFLTKKLDRILRDSLDSAKKGMIKTSE